jgi:hypothetical protein
MKLLTLLALLFTAPLLVANVPVKVAWNPPANELGVAGYIVRWYSKNGKELGKADVGNVQRFESPALSAGDYTFSVTAYGPSRVESKAALLNVAIKKIKLKRSKDLRTWEDDKWFYRITTEDQEFYRLDLLP